jgi:hypothetical protein
LPTEALVTSAQNLVTAAYDYLAGELEFAALYDAALDLDERGLGTESLPRRLAGLVLLAEGEEAAGAYTHEDTRRRIAGLLREEAIAGLRGRGMA